MSNRTALALFFCVLAAALPAAAQGSSSSHQLLITAAAVSDSNVLFLSGANFGEQPDVYVGDQELEVLSVSADGKLLSARMGGPLAPGTYLVHVSAGQGRSQNASFAVTVGAVGPRGDKGDQGPAGPEGVAGPHGPAGPQGEAGPRGPQGERGATGVAGPQGPAGPTGPQGPAGAAGAIGPTGAQGPKGDKGDKGEKGDKGDPGDGGVQTYFADGYGSDPSNIIAFLVSPVTVTVQGHTDRVLVHSARAFGTAEWSGAQDLTIWVCSRLEGGALETQSGGMVSLSVTGNARQVFSVGAMVTGLPAGDYQMGLCGMTTSAGWNSNGLGYTTAVVTR